ncbi:hypothetical protein O181_088291 [Austropuccinia psidii MF-1]|uniref:Uncharacterized protein n=1 Tax=Austropuccinia psidii MF-1 TaxID=1389203 RepID=A0A9Q3IR99_9BASI|nr:hypothetical protein [Austropuccinia psidii MF-1]
MGFERQTKFSFSSLIHFRSRNHTDFFPLFIEQKPPNPPQQDSPIPSMPCEPTPRGPDEPFQHNEPPIPGLSPLSEPPEDILTCEPVPEVAPTQSTEDPFACPATPHSVIIIENMPVGSPPPRHHHLALA